MITVRVNGRPVELEAEQTVLDYLLAIGANPKAVAIELNGEIIQREEYGSAVLGSGAVLEIVRMVGGG